MKISILTIFLAASMIANAAIYNVKDYGAKADGKTLDSPAINAAIEACSEAGGGTIIFDAGTYLSGSIRLKDNIELHLSLGATIKAAPQSMKAYDESESFDFPEYQDGGHTYFHNSLIYGVGLNNISITGQGMIDGSNLTKKDTEQGGIVQGGSIGAGDKAIALKLCRNVLIRDVTIYKGGHFAIIVTGCDRGTIDNVTIDTNRDGIDVDACNYFTISNTKINTPSDDALCLKSSFALKKPVLCQNITITNCIVTGYKIGTFLSGEYIPEKANWTRGRIKLGTESNGGYKNITISNCVCDYSNGLAFEAVDRGILENIVVDNIAMSHCSYYPIYITIGKRNRGPKEDSHLSKGSFIQISNITADDCDKYGGIIITGMEEEKLKDIRLSNIQISNQGGGTKEQGERDYPETNKKQYPEPMLYGTTPAWGLYVRHAENIELNNITFKCNEEDLRPCVILDDVKDISFNSFDAPIFNKKSFIKKHNVDNINITNSPCLR